jgi:TetR/AcrR family transcriptional regulator, mexCD-oprJ operon repressor
MAVRQQWEDGVSADEAGTPRPLRADARRNIETILLAAERCLARDPDASMSDIAAEARLGRVTIYGHFKTRSELVEAVVQRVLRAANEALSDLDLGGDAAAALARLVEATWEVTVRSGSVLIASEKALPATRVRQAHAGPLEDRVRDLIERAQSSGEFRADLPTDWLVATFHAIVHAAANEIDAGRLDTDGASSIITATILGVFSPPHTDSTRTPNRRRTRASDSRRA